MRIGLNLLYLLPGAVGGTQAYAESLVQALAALDTQNEYLQDLNCESAGLEITPAPNFRRVLCRVRAVRRPVRFAYEQFGLPLALRRDRVDLLHSRGYVGPLFSLHELRQHSCPDLLRASGNDDQRRAEGSEVLRQAKGPPLRPDHHDIRESRAGDRRGYRNWREELVVVYEADRPA